MLTCTTSRYAPCPCRPRSSTGRPSRRVQQRLLSRASTGDSMIENAKERIHELQKTAGDRLHDLEENVHKASFMRRVNTGAGMGAQVEELVGKGLHSVGDSMNEALHILEDEFHKVEVALEEGLHAVTDNLADVAHETEDIVKKVTGVAHHSETAPSLGANGQAAGLPLAVAAVAVAEKSLEAADVAVLEVSAPVTRELQGVGAVDTRIGEVLSSNGKSGEPKMKPGSKQVGGPTENVDVKGDMLKPSLANNKWVRLTAIAAAIVAAAGGSSVALRNAAPFMHILAYGVWLGTTVYTTFVLGITMFKNLPRQTFGRLQSKLFPQYFGLSAACLVFQLATLIAGPGLARQQAIQLGTALALTLANLLVVEPKTTALMFARYDLENAAVRDEAEITRLRKQFGGLHGVSSIINLGVVVCAVAHAWWLGRFLSLPSGALLTAKSFGL